MTKTGDTIRISDNAEVNQALKGKRAIVTEVRRWGVCADVPAFDGIYPVRVSNGEFTSEEPQK